MRRFQSLDAIRSASIEELSGTEAMNEKAAEEVFRFFHRGEEKEKKKKKGESL